MQTMALKRRLLLGSGWAAAASLVMVGGVVGTALAVHLEPLRAPRGSGYVVQSYDRCGPGFGNPPNTVTSLGVPACKPAVRPSSCALGPAGIGTVKATVLRDPKANTADVRISLRLKDLVRHVATTREGIRRIACRSAPEMGTSV
jgi:hypothetical protein